MSKQCIDCGSYVNDFTLRCRQCAYKLILDEIFGSDWNSEGYDFNPSEIECEMCGKVGASPRRTGEVMCTQCYQIWKG